MDEIYNLKNIGERFVDNKYMGEKFGDKEYINQENIYMEEQLDIYFVVIGNKPGGNRNLIVATLRPGI